MKIRLASDIQTDSIVDGEGIRAVIWTQGCSHHCPGCHNQITWDFDGGFEVDVEDVLQEISSLKSQDGITFSGGDPLFQVDACLEIAKFAKKQGLNIWCYTGFTFEKLMQMNEKNPHILEFLECVDVLVDGPFIMKERSLDLQFKGSRNQRIIDMPKTLEKKEIVLVSKYIKEKTYTSITNRKKSESVYV